MLPEESLSEKKKGEERGGGLLAIWVATVKVTAEDRFKECVDHTGWEYNRGKLFIEGAVM